MNAIDIQKKSDGKHVINWEKDSLDRILDDLDIYKGVCIPCYGKDNYSMREEAVNNHYPMINDPKHVHREMLKTFAYFAKADGEGILIRSFMENDAEDFEMLYKRDTPAYTNLGVTSFGWRNLSFMPQVKLPDETYVSFPTQVYEIIGDAGSEKEAVESWFEYLLPNENMTAFHGRS